MRYDCKHFESRTYSGGDTVRKCNLDLAPEAPWRCPEDCEAYVKRRVDVSWSYGSLAVGRTPDEPDSVGKDDSVAALLDEAEDVVNLAGARIIAEVEAEQNRPRRFRRRPSSRRGRRSGGGRNGKRRGRGRRP